MCIDSAVLNFSARNMFDQKARLLQNEWLFNQATNPNTMNIASSNVNGAQTPVGLSATPNMLVFQDSGNFSTNRLPSDSRSYSTDTSNDPTPDGPGMDYGNGNCQTPLSDSVCFSPTEFDDKIYPNEMGTPNSFVTDPRPLSPDMFRFNEPRQRQYSGNSSMYTYSPYNGEDEHMPLGQSCTTPGLLNRQSSLAMVEEVLGTTGDCAEICQLFPCEDSPLLACNEDSCLPPYPSPSFSAHFNANNDLAFGMNMSSSQGDEFYNNFCQSDINGIQCEGSPLNTDSNKTDCNNNACNNNDESENAQSPAQEIVVSNEVTQPTLSFLPVPAMSRQLSNVSDIFTDSLPSNSLDTQEMLQDCLKNLPVSKESHPQIPQSTMLLKVLSISTCSPLPQDTYQHPESPEMKEEHIPTTCAKSTECDKPTTSGVRRKETDVTAARRERNNEACRLSRKRRKNKKREMEKDISDMTNENEILKEKIKELEVECKRARKMILTGMTQNTSR